MSETQVYGGVWKLFEKEKLYQGELHINNDKRIIALEILIPASDENPMPSTLYKGKIPYICGTLFSGAKILLYQCTTGKEHHYIMSYTQQIIHVDYAFWGLEVKSEDEIRFTSMIFDFGEIIEWSGLCNYSWDFNENGGSNLMWVHKDKVEYELNDELKVTFYPIQGNIESDMFKKKIIANQRVLIEFVYLTPTKLNLILEDVLCMQYLIGMGINHKVEIDCVKYYHSSIYTEISKNDGTIEKEYRVADMNLGTGSVEPTPNTRHYNFLFTLDDINKKDVFIKWKANYSVLKPVLDLYFTAFSKSAGTPEMLFLNLMQALETYHARFITDDVKVYIDRVNKIVDSSYWGNKNSEYWKNFLIDEEQKKRSRIHLKSRLADLIFANGILPFGPDSSKREKYISKIIDTRNYFTHYNPEKLNKAFTKSELPLINGHLLALLEYHTLVLIGFLPEEVKKKIVEKVHRIDDAHSLKKQTHDLER